MKSINIPIPHKTIQDYKEKNILSSLKKYIHKNEAVWEYNKLGIGTVGVFLQVTVAAVMIGILGITHGNMWIGGIGIFFAFMANSIVFMQGRILWMIFAVLSSIVVNATITIYYVLS